MKMYSLAATCLLGLGLMGCSEQSNSTGTLQSESGAAASTGSSAAETPEPVEQSSVAEEPVAAARPSEQPPATRESGVADIDSPLIAPESLPPIAQLTPGPDVDPLPDSVQETGGGDSAPTATEESAAVRATRERMRAIAEGTDDAARLAPRAPLELGEAMEPSKDISEETPVFVGAGRVTNPQETSALASVRSFVTAQAAFLAAEGRYGSLAELGAGESPYIVKELAGGRKDLYTFQVSVSGDAYTVVAAPPEGLEGTIRRYFTDQTGIIRYTDDQSMPNESSPKIEP